MFGFSTLQHLRLASINSSIIYMRAINIFYAYSCIHIHGASVCQMKRMGGKKWFYFVCRFHGWATHNSIKWQKHVYKFVATDRLRYLRNVTTFVASPVGHKQIRGESLGHSCLQIQIQMYMCICRCRCRMEMQNGDAELQLQLSCLLKAGG